MRTLLVGMFLVSFGTTAADASCHKYSHWYYPWPQKCKMTRMVAYAHVTPINVPQKIPVVLPPHPHEEAIPIPVPDLAGIWSSDNKELKEELERKKALILLLDKP